MLDGWSKCGRGGDCPAAPYTDISTEAWYHDGIHFCLENQVMNGYSDMTFKPNNTLSRAQLAQVLYNLEGKPTVMGGSPFTDVADDAWCAAAVTWAAGANIVGGYGDGRFGPNNPITRQQFATMLWRYAKAKGYDVSVGQVADVYAFKDFGQVSDYAVAALQWAVGRGVVGGKGGVLDPTGSATRAQTAVMLQRYPGTPAQ